MCFLLQYRRIPPFCYPSSISTETVTLALTVHLHLFLTFLILFLTLQFLKEITHNVCGKKIKQPTTQTICDDLSPKDRLSPINHASMVKDNHTQLPKQNIIQQQNHCSWRAFVHWSNSEFPEGEVPAKYLSKANLTLGQTVPVSPFRNLTMPFLNPCTSTSLLL